MVGHTEVELIWAKECSAFENNEQKYSRFSDTVSAFANCLFYHLSRSLNLLSQLSVQSLELARAVAPLC